MIVTSSPAMAKTTPVLLPKLHLLGDRTACLTQARGRLMLMGIVFSLLGLMIMIRAFDLMVIQGTLAKFRETYQTQGPLTSVQSEPRRDIVDRNGLILATSIRTASLYADPKLILDFDGTVDGLARIFPDLSPALLAEKLAEKSRFVWIKRNLTPREQAAVLELGQPGLGFQEDYRRIYPQGAMTAHVVGYSGVDAQGLSGIEQSMNNMLRQDGKPLALTLDVRIQHILRREMQRTIKDFRAQGGAGIVMNVKTGEVLAAVSLPDFDPHQPAEGADVHKFNRVSLGTYELGSTFKIFTTAALLEQQNVPLTTSYDTRQPIKAGRFTISDFHPENRVQTIPEVFIHSSNIGTAMMAQQIGTPGLKSFFDQLGLLGPLAGDLPERGRPLVPSPWRDISTLTASYGHGLAVTPLHLAAATATLIGDGTRVTPHFIPRPSRGKTPVAERVLSVENVEKMRGLLRLAVADGTGAKADVPGLMVGGKTGTAEKSVGGRYVHDALLTTFVGAFPMNDPEILVQISIDDPKPNKNSFGYATAGWNAAPCAARVMAAAANVLGWAPDADMPDLAQAFERYITVDPKTDDHQETNIISGVTPVAAR